jgi:hypothetical protein
MPGPPSNLLAGFAGLLQGIDEGIEQGRQRKRQKALDAANKISTDALREHQKSLDAIAAGREQRLDEEFKERNRLKKEIADLNAAAKSETDATKRYQIQMEAWSKSLQLSQPYSGSAGDNVNLSRFLQESMPGAPPAIPGAQGSPGQPPAPQGQPIQPQGNRPVGIGNALGAIGPSAQSAITTLPQGPPTGQPPISTMPAGANIPGAPSPITRAVGMPPNPFTGASAPPPGTTPQTFSMQGAPGQAVPPATDPYNPGPTAPISQKAAANAATIAQKNSTIPVNEARAKVLTQDEMLKNIQAQTARELASNKISKIQADTINAQANHELILARTKHEEALRELIGAQTRLTNAKTKLEPLRVELEKARISVEKERASNPGLSKDEKWLAAQNRELGQAMSSIISKQEPFIKAINTARAKVAGFEQITSGPPPTKPQGDMNDQAFQKVFGNWQKEQALYDYAKTHIPALKDEIAENEDLNRQLEHEKALVTRDITKYGLTMQTDGHDDPKRTKAVQEAAAAEAKRKEEEVKKHRKKPVVAPGGVAPAVISGPGFSLTPK